jgi:glycosyltransferase involved in cell wall biosynthesis
MDGHLVIQPDSAAGRTLAERVTGVAILLDSAPRTWTSMEEINLRLARSLTALGIRVVLVYAAELPPELDRRMRAAGAAIEVAPYGHDRFRFYGELGRIFKKHSVSMVHVCFFDYFSLVPWLTRLQGLRCIIYEELNSGMLNAISWKKRLLQVRTAITTLPMTRIIAVSEFVKHDLIKRGISADRIVVRHLGADETRFRPDPTARHHWAAEYSIQPGELLMSSVTLLRPFKSPDTLIEACALLARRGVAARLLVAGDGAMLGELRKLSKRLGTEDRIHWLGFSPDPTDLIQASDVFLLASVGEAGGFVLSEAMGCGVPIVGSRSGVISECVEEGHTGLLATPKDAKSFADAIETLAADEALRLLMSKNSRTRMLQRFTTDISVQGTLSIYASTLTG